jgi:hypothetical protein
MVNETRARDAPHCGLDVFVRSQPIVGGVHEQSRHGDVFQRKSVRRRLRHHRVEGAAEALLRDRKKRPPDREDVAVVRGVLPFGDAHDPGEKLRPVPLQKPPSPLPPSDAANEWQKPPSDRGPQAHE